MSKRVILLALLFAFGSGSAFCQNNSAPTNDVGIQYLGHVGVAVTDIDAAMHFYCDQLGFTEIFRLNKPDGSLWLVYLRLNNNNYLELFPGAVKPSGSTANQPGINHMGFWVKDLQVTLHTLQDRGYKLPDNAFKAAAVVKLDGSLLYNVKDPDGNIVELSQMTPDSKEAKSQR